MIGAQRTEALFEHLRAKGHQACLLTGEQSGPTLIAHVERSHDPIAARGMVHTTDSRRLQTLRRSGVWQATARYKRAVFDWPDPGQQRIWYREASRVFSRDPSQAEFDVVVSSGPPWVCHKLAREIAARQDIPWVPDYRDLWTNGSYYPHPSWRRVVESQIERHWLASASAVTSVTPGLCRELSDFAPGTKCETIWNGFTGSEMASVPSTELGAGRHWVYAGSWYLGKRDPRPMLDALTTEVRKVKTTLHLVGEVPTEVSREVDARGLAGHVVIHGTVNRGRALSIIKSADVAFVLSWNDPRDKDVVGGKVFEIIGLHRPVVAVAYPDGVLADVIRGYGFGYVANSAEEISSSIEDLYERLDNGESPDERVVDGFDRRVQLEHWEELLLRTCDRLR